jgi:hypothetical protein
LGQSDLVISCNFDLPVETDAIPVNKKNHKTTHIAEKKRFFINFKAIKNTVASKSNLAVAAPPSDQGKCSFP